MFTYTYDAANRPITIKQGTTLTYTYSYNGLGDRVKQVVNGVPTTYTLDLNAGLTQVLADGTNTYLYGNGRIAQYAGTTPAYFLGDALGSVRQLTSANGAVTLARSYQPYGNVLTSAGTGATSYAFTGEWQDATGLLHLRARSYGPQWGRFISADTWNGDYRRPLTLNKWNYSLSNPVNYTDPSGHMACKDIISSWRPVFEALRLCDPNEQPTLDPEAITGNGSVICQFGYTSFGGLVCTQYRSQCDVEGSFFQSQFFANEVSKKDCQTAIKLLTQYERLAQKFGIKLPPDRLRDLNRKRDEGTITSYDLPGTLQREMPPQFAGLTLSEIRRICRM